MKNRIKRPSLPSKFKVQVVARGIAGAANPGDDFALQNPLSPLDQVAAVVRVSGFDSPAVIDDNHTAIAPATPRENHPPAGGRVNRSSARCAQIDAGVQATPAVAEI